MNYHAQSVADKEVARAATACQAKELAELMGCRAAERMSGIRRSHFAILRSQIAIQYSQFALRNSQFAIRKFSRNSHLAIRSLLYVPVVFVPFQDIRHISVDLNTLPQPAESHHRIVIKRRISLSLKEQ